MGKLGLELLAWVKLLSTSLFMVFANQAISQSSFDSIDVFINDYMKENHVPGLACCVVKEEKMYWFNSYGEANIEKNKPMTIDALMNVASISKTITATATMQLWEKGLIDLEADINDYLDFQVRNPKFLKTPITIFQLLTHTSSICDGSAYSNSYSCGDPKISLEYWIYHYLTSNGEFYNESENFCHWKPGSKRDYSNVAYGLLGLLVEKVSKLPFNEYCNRNIFGPLEMNNTGWYLSEIDTLNHVIPYSYIWNVGLIREYPKDKLNGLNDYCPFCLYSFPNYPDGLVRTSVRELSCFLISMINNGEYKNSRILEESTVEKMLTLQLSENNSQGLCWHKNDFENLWGHSGGDPGVETHMYFNPDSKIGIVTFQNCSSWKGNSFDILKKLYLVASKQYL